jgi:hypothetical protein
MGWVAIDSLQIRDAVTVERLRYLVLKLGSNHLHGSLDSGGALAPGALRSSSAFASATSHEWHI